MRVVDKAAVKRFKKLSSKLDSDYATDRNLAGIDWIAGGTVAELRCTDECMAARARVALEAPVEPARGHGLWAPGELELPDFHGMLPAPCYMAFEAVDLVSILKAIAPLKSSTRTLRIVRGEASILIQSCDGPGIEAELEAELGGGEIFEAVLTTSYLKLALATYAAKARVGLSAGPCGGISLYSPSLSVVIAGKVPE